MPTYVAILRGINVGGKQMLMADLRELLTQMGLGGVRTYIQSGNVLFTDGGSSSENLASTISSQIKLSFGFDVPVIVRTAAEMRATLAANPFVGKAETGQLHLTFLSDCPESDKLRQISQLSYPPDEFRIIGNDVYLRCVTKYHQTKLNNHFFEKKLGVSASTRNWKTVMKLVELTDG